MLLAAFCFMSCSKDQSSHATDNNNKNDATTERKVVERIYYDFGGSFHRFDFLYDDAGRVKQVKQNNNIFNYEYNTSQVIVKDSKGNQLEVFDFVGDKLFQHYWGSSNPVIFEYEGTMMKPTKSDGWLEFDLTWDESGNLVSRVVDGSQSVQYTYYDVVDKSNIDIFEYTEDCMMIERPFDRNVFKCLSSTNLRASQNDVNWNYRFDDEGYVIEANGINSDHSKEYGIEISYKKI